MTLNEYKARMADALTRLDWHNPRDPESEAYKVLQAAAKDRELDDIGDWAKLYNQYMEGVTRR